MPTVHLVSVHQEGFLQLVLQQLMFLMKLSLLQFPKLILTTYT